MKTCLRYSYRVLRYAWWLPALLTGMALLMGIEAGSAVNTYAARYPAGLEAWESVTLLADIRHFFPLAGVVWSALWFGMEFGAGGHTQPLRQGFTRFQLWVSKFIWFLAGCIAVSLLEQAFALGLVHPDLCSVPTDRLLRICGLRLLLDTGLMTFPAFIPILARENLYGRAGGCLYGVALWRLMGTHYGLWAPELTAPPQLWEWWPIPALILGLLFSALALRKDTM